MLFVVYLVGLFVAYLRLKMLLGSLFCVLVAYAFADWFDLFVLRFWLST